MQKLVLLLFVLLSFQGISQLEILPHSNILLVGPNTIETPRVELATYYSTYYQELSEQLTDAAFNNSSEREELQSELEQLDTYILLWQEVVDKHPFVSLVQEMPDCFEVSSATKTYTFDEVRIQENEAWQRDELVTFEQTVAIEKMPGPQRDEGFSSNNYKRKKVTVTEHMVSNSKDKTIACLEWECGYTFNCGGEQVQSRHLPENYTYFHGDHFIVSTIEFMPEQYEIIEKATGERIEIERWWACE